MVQIPVLPLPTPLGKLTHGVYCDEFAEFQSRDLPARVALGGFLPSCGVGAGYSRRALELLAGAAANCLFDPGCLTEDYDVGLRLHRLGCRQVFVPIRFLNGQPLATRELFPDFLEGALRQRTRWMIGIALQCWQKHGWTEWYWFWRDRKGLAGNPLSLVVNALTLYGLVTWLGSGIRGDPWGLAEAVWDQGLGWLFEGTLLLLLWRAAVRAGCVARLYGWKFALGVPVRVVWATWVNGLATLAALERYFEARLRRRPLVWLKTDHRYPSRSALVRHKRLLGEILVGSGCLEGEQLERALGSQPADRLLGDHLVRLGMLSEEALYEALSLQQNLPFEKLEPARIQRRASQALAPAVARRWKVVPFRLEPGKLCVAGPGLPTEEAERELRTACGLEIRFHLITPSNLAALTPERRRAPDAGSARGPVPVQ
jgi:adsorption protein B